ncbi:MAG TPA: L,D-transpeptidase family protein [Streptosporangiaceae bacterium]
MRPWLRLTAGVACASLLGGCATGATPLAGSTRAASTPAPATRQPAGGTATGRAGASQRPSAGPALADPLAGHQLITLTAPSYGDTYATFTAYRRAGGRWRRVLGPWTARIGRNGFAPPGQKREGDGRTPSGTFRFGFLFGVLPNPGVQFRYRQSNSYDYWDDDPASPRYNEWVDTRRASPGLSPEPMDVWAYDYGAVIGYNTARTPGLGSAIFLHQNIGIATAGCVTLPTGDLLRVLRWLDPARSPRIRMGVAT